MKTRNPVDASISSRSAGWRALVLAAGVIQAAHAQEVIYSNLGPNGSYVPGGYGSVPNIAHTPAIPYAIYQGVGPRLTAGITGALGSIEAPLQLLCTFTSLPNNCDTISPAGASAAAWLTIMADDNGVPGAPLAVSSAVQVGSLQMYTFDFSSQPILQSGSTYWVRGDVELSAVLLGWNNNPLGLNGVAQWGGSFNQSPTFTTYFTTLREPAIRVLAVPEPGTFVLFAAALALLGLRLKRKAQGPEAF